LPNIPVVDANFVLRYLLDDHPELSERARGVIDSGRKLFLRNEILCKVVWVLAKVYGVGRREISSILTALVARPQFELSSREVVCLALETYGLRSIDIANTPCGRGFRQTCSHLRVSQRSA
jgi:predicted nucleic-acid-binding protein